MSLRVTTRRNKRSRAKSPSPDREEPQSRFRVSLPEVAPSTDDELLGETGQNKKLKVITNLSKAEEESMAKWLCAKPVIYNKKLQEFKDIARKEKLWQDKANDIGKSVVVLKTWYSSMRSRYGRLKKTFVLDNGTEGVMTERDRWILTNFSFLMQHISEAPPKCKKSPVVISVSATPHSSSIVKEEKQEDNSNSETDQASASTNDSTTPVIFLSPQNLNSSQNNVSTSNNLQGLAVMPDQVSEPVSTVKQALARSPDADREREAFLEWTKSVVNDLDHSIWRQCQQDISQILFRYIGENDKVKTKHCN